MFNVKSKSHTYSVKRHASIHEALSQSGAKDKSFYLVDSEILRLYPGALAIDGLVTADRMLSVIATEGAKSYSEIEALILKLIEMGMRRDSELVVVGGGVLQDIGCFISSVLFRGLKWKLIPTTLLAQCDSCIGGKSSVNIGPYKNQLGTFYAPHEILVVEDVLKTLPFDEMRSGMGEVIKIFLLGHPEETSQMKKWISSWLSGDHSVVRNLVDGALAIKKRYIEEDEFDMGVRNLLNYGHTFGHAFEAATKFAIPHGIAVSIGMIAATEAAETFGLKPYYGGRDFLEFMRPIVSPYGSKLKDVSVDAILSGMKKDKKNQGSTKVTCILPNAEKKHQKFAVEAESELRLFLKQFVSSIDF